MAGALTLQQIEDITGQIILFQGKNPRTGKQLQLALDDLPVAVQNAFMTWVNNQLFG